MHYIAHVTDLTQTVRHEMLCADLLFGGYIPHIVLGGEMRLDDSEAGATHAFAYSFGKIAKSCHTP